MTRQDYYEHLVNIGLPDLIAASMAAQTDNDLTKDFEDNMVTEVFSFALWAETIEGVEFWGPFKDCLL